MDIGSLLLIIVTILIIAISIFVADRYLPQDPMKLPEAPDIPKFSANVHFDPYPSTTNIENQYDCNAQSLRKCDITDSSTLFGCKELTARCRHFDEDVKYYRDGKESIIPKNSSPNEGYALAITTLADACNPYHGDLVLVAANRESTEYMLICSCKNPGFIGNEHLLGNCSDVFICDGKVDNIDQPFENIQCVCDTGKISKRANKTDAPVCEVMTVKDANEKLADWTDLLDFKGRDTLNIRHFNATLRGNLKVRELVNPCLYAINDYSINIPDAEYSYVGNRCRFYNSGIPVRTGVLEKPKEKPDASMDGVLESGPYDVIRFTDNVAGHRRRAAIYADMRFHPSYSGYKGLMLVENAYIGYGETNQIVISPEEGFIAPRCEGSWPTYHCKTDNGWIQYAVGFPIAKARDCPQDFLWNREYWTDAETLTARSINTTSNSFEINQKNLTTARLPFYGVVYRRKGAAHDLYNGLLRMNYYPDFIIHKSTIS